MLGIPFGKFFDSQSDHSLIASFELVKSEELSHPGDDWVYLLKSNLTNDHYIIVDADHGPDEDEANNWAQKNSQKKVGLKAIPPKNPKTYAGSYYLFLVVTES